MREEYFIKRINTLIENYTFEEPFANYLKSYFRKHPEMGGKDRRDTREWAFNFFRIGLNLKDLPFKNRLAIALYLCSNESTPSLNHLIGKYSTLRMENIENTIEKKVNDVSESYPEFKIENIFQLHELLSPSIDKVRWYLSFLKKPRVWIRMRENYRKNVLNELKRSNIHFIESEYPLIVSFSSSLSLEKTISFQKGYFEIQDKSSQLTRDFFTPGRNEYWWDACAGSGGKSLLLTEQSSEVKIFATDTRRRILENYSERLLKTGFKNFTTQVLDFSSLSKEKIQQKFDGIIADVPCSGSGTWARSPEWLLRDISNKIDEYFVPLQRKIIESVLPSLKSGSPLIYITCSVFKKENEENIQFFLDHFGLKLEKSTYLDGSGEQADTLFVARLIKDR
jgi:16S rRNA (cytosine967-C5)-methyltransferase